jgi:hypothetical protein
MADPKLNNKGFDTPDVKGGGTSLSKSSASPRALREGNAEPEHFEGDSGSLGMDEPSKSDDINDHAWGMQGERYSNLYW